KSRIYPALSLSLRISALSLAPRNVCRSSKVSSSARTPFWPGASPTAAAAARTRRRAAALLHGRRRDAERGGDLSDGRFFRRAHLRPAEAEESAFGRGLGDRFGDAGEPGLERQGVRSALCVKQGRGRLQRVDRLGRQVGRGLGAGNRSLHSVLREPAPCGGLKLAYDRLDEGVRPRIGLRLKQRAGARHALLHHSDEPARIGGGNRDARGERGLKQELPFIRSEIGLGRHALLLRLIAPNWPSMTFP